MRRTSRQAVLAGLVLPGVCIGLALIAIAVLAPQVSGEVVMQWSFDGEPSRSASPFELLLAPLVAAAVSLLIWALLPSSTVAQAHLGLAVGNGVAGFCGGTAVALIAGQLGDAVMPGYPGTGLALALIPALGAAGASLWITRGATGD